MNSDIVQKELNMIEADRKLAELALDADKEAFANRLRNGLGKEIRTGLMEGNRPIPIKIPKKHKFKKFIKRLIGVFVNPEIDDETMNLLPNGIYGEGEE